MRKTSFHLDQESTIISMLALDGAPEGRSSSRPAPRIWALLAGVALAALVVYLVRGGSW